MSKQMSVIQEFKTAMTCKKAQTSFAAQLPSDVPVDKFTAVVIRAVQEDPDLLRADRTSLFLACQRAAQDGLIPDKREGALVVYNTKINDQWVQKVQWQIMIGGIRKRLANNGFDIRAEVVYEADFFDQELGDEPKITHKPPQPGSERGKVTCAYAIATHLETGRKYREVMSIDQLDKVRSVAKSDRVWKQWDTEMMRKTVARRLAKFLPMTDSDDRLAAMIERDNENFDLEKTTGPSSTAKAVQEAAKQPAKAIESKDQDLPPAEAQEQPPEAVAVETENPSPDVQTEPVAVAEGGMSPGF